MSGQESSRRVIHRVTLEVDIVLRLALDATVLPTSDGVAMSVKPHKLRTVRPKNDPQGSAESTAIPDHWPQDPKDFGRAVREARQAAKISQIDLAARVGITDTTLRSVEHANRKTQPMIRRWIVQALASFGLKAPGQEITSIAPSDATDGHAAVEDSRPE